MSSSRRGMMGVLIASALACACTDASIGDSPGGDAGSDVFPDAGDVVDLPPPDAGVTLQACTEGDRRRLDVDTNRCYFAFTTPATWTAARAACSAAGGDLARIDSIAENDVVFQLALDPAVPGQPDWWVGGNDRTTENRFVWNDDTTEIVAPLFEQWRIGEPNNGGTLALNEDCMIIESDNPLHEWDDRNCDTTPYPYICERAP